MRELWMRVEGLRGIELRTVHGLGFQVAKVDTDVLIRLFGADDAEKQAAAATL